MRKSAFAGIAALVIGLALIGCDTGGNDKYTATYNTGRGEGTAPTSQTVDEGTTIYLPNQGNMTPPSGETFDGWKDGGGMPYTAGESYTMDANVKFTAQWKTGGGLGGSFKLEGDVYESNQGILGITYTKTAKTGTITASPGNATAKLSNSHFSMTIGEPPDSVLENFSSAILIAGFDDLLGEAGGPKIVLNPDSGVKAAVLTLTLDDGATIQKTETELSLLSLSPSMRIKTVVYMYVDNDINVTMNDWTYTIPTGGAEPAEETGITIIVKKSTLELTKGWNPVCLEIKTPFSLTEPTGNTTITVSGSVGDPDLKWVIGDNPLPIID
ncbi:hypothetical protein AGMMS4952_07880 [Spirochaetia bacterium]|nr:hypothetical protein AGMMS4952_07880 [Spirochaetia bacterium]